MGIGTESVIVNQLKKAQGETNQRIDALIREHQLTNQLLQRLIDQIARTSVS